MAFHFEVLALLDFMQLARVTLGGLEPVANALGASLQVTQAESRTANRLRDSVTPVACARQYTDRFNCLLAANRLQVKTGCIRAPVRPLNDTWRSIMSDGLYYLAVVLGIAVVGIFAWRYFYSAKSRAKRKQRLSSREVVQQPWGDDKDGGRGNR